MEDAQIQDFVLYSNSVVEVELKLQTQYFVLYLVYKPLVSFKFTSPNWELKSRWKVLHEKVPQTNGNLKVYITIILKSIN